VSLRERLSAPGTALLLVAFLWGAGFTASKAAVGDVPPLTNGFVRYLFASLVLVPLLWYGQRQAPRRQRLAWPAWRALIALALTAVVGYNAFYFTGLSYAPSSDSILLIPTTTPIWTTLIALALIGERPTGRLLAGMLIALCGMILVLIGGLDADYTAERMVGNLLFIAAAIIFGFSYVMSRIATRYVSPLEATTIAGVLGGLALLPPALVEGGVDELFAAPALYWFNILFIAWGVTAVGYVLWYRSVARIGAGRTSFYNNLVPLFGLTLSALFLAEYPTPLQLLGGALMLGAVIWATRRPTPEPQSAAAHPNSAASP
jgi:drug/metabolite transporter (DMT)-like permease